MKRILASLAAASCLAVGAHAAVTGVTWKYNNDTRTHVFTRGVAITPDTATTEGQMQNNATNGCNAVPALPAGLTLTFVDQTHCELAGTPTATSPTQVYHVHFRAAQGADLVSHLTITVGPVTNLSYPRIVTATVGRAMTPVTPTLGLSTGTITYSADSALPAGLSLSPATGAISGTASTAFAGRTYTIKASNGTDSTTATVRIVAKAAVNYSAWSGRRVITVNPSGLNLGAPVTNFPVLVRLNEAYSEVFTTAAANGADVRFTAADSVTPLPFHIERWDATAKRAEVWVTLPSVSNTTNTTFLMHYGMAGQTSASDGAETFSTHNGFQAVWHMSAAAALTEPDATANAINATPTGTTSNPNGAVGVGRTFDGGSYLTAVGSADGPLNFDQNSGWTIGAWVTMDAPEYQRTIVSKSNFQYALQTSYAGGDGPRWETVEYQVITGRSGWPHAFSPADSMKATVWTYVVGVSRGGALYNYVNGNLAGASPPGTDWDNSTAARNTTTDVSIGGMFENQSAGLSRGWIGDIDEVQMSNVVRDSNWIRLSFATQRPGATAVTVGGEVTGILPAGSVASPAFSVKAFDGSFRFAIPEGANGGRVAVLDVNGRPVWSTAVGAGAREVSWNGRAANGSVPARGMYFARFTAADGRTWESRLALTR